jgi:hypothetical protein
MQLCANTSENYVATVWSTTDGSLVWAPPRARAIGFTTRESAACAIVVRDVYHRDETSRQGPWVIGSPLQSEYTTYLEIVDWTSRTTLGSTEIRFPTGWTDRIVIFGSCVAVIYNEQSEGGYVLVDLDPAVRQRPDHELRALCDQGSFLGPVASGDGRLLVSATPVGWRWWAPKERQDEIDGDDPPSDGGRKRVATLYVHDVASGHIEARPVEVDLPVGWTPPRPEDDFERDSIFELEFRAERTVQLLLPTEERRTIEI